MTNIPAPPVAAAPTPADPRRSRVRAFTVSGIAAACLVGGAATAYAADGGGASTPSTPPAGSSSAPSTPPTSTAPARSGAQPPVAKHAPHLDGTVTRAGAGTITITDRDGFTRTIDVTATVYTGGLSATPATGTRIHAEGTVDSNGTALDATRVGSHPTPPAGGPARHAKPGHGAPKAGAPARQAKPTPGAAPKTGAPVGPGKHVKPGKPGKPGSGAPKAGGLVGQAKPAPGTARPGKPAAPAGTVKPTPAPTGSIGGS